MANNPNAMTQSRLAAHHLETIVGQIVELIPYEREHVPLFQHWLQDSEMQRLVRTKALPLEEEYQHQRELASATSRMIKLIRPREGPNRLEPIGDVDFFFDGDGVAEVNIMIADPELRRHGFASQALTLAMEYAVQKFQISKFIAKIAADNIPSLRFFERHGFARKTEQPNVFGELLYELDAGELPQSDLLIKSNFEIKV